MLAQCFALVTHFFDILTPLKLSCNLLTFFDDFSSSFGGFGVVWGWILGLLSRIFSDYIDKRDFAKISVSPRREHDFQGFELSKIHEKSTKSHCKFGAEKYRCANRLKKGFGWAWSFFWEGSGEGCGRGLEA